MTLLLLTSLSSRCAAVMQSAAIAMVIALAGGCGRLFESPSYIELTNLSGEDVEITSAHTGLTTHAANRATVLIPHGGMDITMRGKDREWCYKDVSPRDSRPPYATQFAYPIPFGGASHTAHLLLAPDHRLYAVLAGTDVTHVEIGDLKQPPGFPLSPIRDDELDPTVDGGGLTGYEVAEALGKLGITFQPGQAIPEGAGIYLSTTDAHIKLRTDQLSKGIIEIVRQLRSLKAVFMVGAEVTDATLERIKSLTQIRELRLVKTNVTDAGLKHITAFARLDTLFLHKSPISGEGMEHLNTLKCLQILSLFGTSVGDSGVGHIKRLTSLWELGLRYTKVTDAGLEHLLELPRLRELDLSGTDITDVGLTHIVRMAKLAKLDLTATRVTAEGVIAVRKALPECRIAALGKWEE